MIANLHNPCLDNMPYGPYGVKAIYAARHCAWGESVAALPLLELSRINYGNSRKALEMAGVESQDARHGIHLHNGSQVGVMSLFARYSENLNYSLPHLQHLGSGWQQAKESPLDRSLQR